MLKESDDLIILGVTLDSTMPFKRQLRSVYRSASKRLGILRKSWRVFHDRSLLGICLRCLVLPVLEYCSAVWCSAVDTHLELLDRVGMWCQFLNRGCLLTDIAHRRSVAVPCMQYKISCNPMHRHYGALSVPYVPMRVARGALGTHGILMRHVAAEPRSTSPQNLAVPQDLYFLSMSLWTDLADPVFDGVGLVGFKNRANAFLLALAAISLFSTIFHFSSFCVYSFVLYGLGHWTDRVLTTLFQPCTADHFTNNNNNTDNKRHGYFL